ncbi:MAG: glycoside hydrolase family 2 protein [Planctomycetota bacterium]
MTNPASVVSPSPRLRQPLPVDWTLSLASVEAGVEVPIDRDKLTGLPATVPGCVHTDLLAADLIPDPYLAEHEPQTHWIGRCDWAYETRFELGPEALGQPHLELVFEGLDTVARVEVNGQEVGRSENMHRRYRFDLKPVAQPGSNTLRVTFDSPYRFAHQMQAKFGERPYTGLGSNPPLPHHMMRKMACNFGWDWGPQLLTCGIWRPAFIEAWGTARLGDAVPGVTRADPDHARVELAVEVIGDRQDATLHAILRDPEGDAVAEGFTQPPSDGPARLILDIDKPQRWWPLGYGKQPLYTLSLTLQHADGQTLDTTQQRVGLRTVELVTDSDPEPVAGLGQGETFHLRVNGQRVFCKGANWIPDDCFPHRVTPERYRRRIEQAIDVNMNMLRVWGGGTYEDHAFYDVCDERGVLVWQDFMLACACYPEASDYAAWVEAEARDNVARLSRHASLVLWNGCNENIMGAFEWPDFIDYVRQDGADWGLKYYLELFPRVVEELAPATPFWFASPYSGSMDRHPNANGYGNRHIWDVWNRHGDYRNYLGHFPRFASEFGYQGPPTWPTLTRAIPEDQRGWMSDTMQHHNKQNQGQQRALDRIADDFDGIDADTDPADVWFLATVNQCRALTLGCEWFRALSPWCGGALYWQFNDCWPVTSWAAVDGDGRPKMLWHATRRFFRDRLLTILPVDVTPSGQAPERMAVRLHNDTDRPWCENAQVQLRHIDGRVLEEHADRFDIPPRGTACLPVPADWPDAPGHLIFATTADDRAFYFFGRDRDIAYPTPIFDTRLETTADGCRLHVRTDQTVRDLYLLAERLDPDAQVHPQGITLLPGNTTIFEIKSTTHFTAEQLSHPNVLRYIGPSLPRVEHSLPTCSV